MRVAEVKWRDSYEQRDLRVAWKTWSETILGLSGPFKSHVGFFSNGFGGSRALREWVPGRIILGNTGEETIIG